MRGKLSAKDKIIIAALFLFDRLAEVQDYFDNPRNIEPYRLQSDMVGWYLEQVKKEPSARSALYRLHGEEDISFSADSLDFLIDPRAFINTYYWRKFRLIVDDKDWDGLWRLVIFDIPEKERKMRSAIRYHLKKIGFVYWQKSVWVTIFDVKKELDKILKEIGGENHIIVLEAKNIGPMRNERIIKEMFPVGKIDSRYRDFINNAKLAVKTKDSNLAKRLQNDFIHLVCDDPGIPKNFLSRPDLRRRALNLFKQLALNQRQASLK